MTGPLFNQQRGATVWDTSAIIAIKERVERRARPRVLKALRRLAEEERLFFPREILVELDRWHRAPDELTVWARGCEASATAVVHSLDTVRTVLSRVPRLLDPDAPYEEADPYVLALALELTGPVVVVTDDTKDRPTKMSLATACGVFRIPCLSLMPFLIDEGILPPSTKLV